MRGISAEGLADSEAKVEELASAGEAARLGSELFAVADLLGREAALRRAMTDPSTSGKAKSSLASAVFEGKLSPDAIQVVATAAGARWSSAGDFVDAIEQLAALAFVIESESAGKLSELEDELFRFARIVEAEPRLRDVLGDRTAPLSAKRKLLDGLIKDKVSEPTRLLLAEAVAGRHRSFLAAVADYQRIAAARRDRLVATVHVAAPLSRDQERRLSKALADEYGHAVHVNVVVDPRLLGGVRATVEDEVVDSTIATRLEDARRKLAG